MKIQVQKGIPLEKRREPRSRYPFEEMEVGDSFFVKCDEGSLVSKRSTVLSSSIYYGKMCGKKFTSRTFPDGFRIWRVK